MTSATTTRLPAGNSGREYAVEHTDRGTVRVVTLTGRRVLPTACAEFDPAAARALGVELITVAAVAEYASSARHPRGDGSTTRGPAGRRYTVRMTSGTNRPVRLVVRNVHDEILSSLTDSFTLADARSLGAELIAEAGPQ